MLLISLFLRLEDVSELRFVERTFELNLDGGLLGRLWGRQLHQILLCLLSRHPGQRSGLDFLLPALLYVRPKSVLAPLPPTEMTLCL